MIMNFWLKERLGMKLYMFKILIIIRVKISSILFREIY